MKGIWFSELQQPGLAISVLTQDILHHEKSDFQDIKVIDTYPFGRTLVLDDVIQTTVHDEFAYHEMISLVALNTHPTPKNVLIIGGGDGGTLREVTKHPKVEKATMVEIDERVIEVSKEFLPEIACGFENPKAEVRVEDGIKFVENSTSEFDIIIIDSTDPVGPAQGLFSFEFYTNAKNALTDEGIFTAQTESPFFDRKMLRCIVGNVKELFPICRFVQTFVPTYPGGLWLFTMGSKKYKPEEVNINEIPELDTKYYSREVHQSCLVLSPFVKELLE